MEIMQQRLDESINNARKMLDVSIKVANDKFELSITNAKAKFEETIKHSKHILDTSINLAKKSLEDLILELKQELNGLNENPHQENAIVIQSKRSRPNDIEIKQEQNVEEENNFDYTTDANLSTHIKQERPESSASGEPEMKPNVYDANSIGSILSPSLFDHTSHGYPSSSQQTINEPYRTNQGQSSNAYSSKRKRIRYTNTNLVGIIPHHVVASFNVEVNSHFSKRSKEKVKYFVFYF